MGFSVHIWRENDLNFSAEKGTDKSTYFLSLWTRCKTLLSVQCTCVYQWKDKSFFLIGSRLFFLHPHVDQISGRATVPLTNNDRVCSKRNFSQICSLLHVFCFTILIPDNGFISYIGVSYWGIFNMYNWHSRGHLSPGLAWMHRKYAGHSPLLCIPIPAK